MSAAREGMRKGWCPGALRPMRSGDGLIARLRITGGIVPSGLARGIAACARDFGTGALDLSGRANLQLRGIADAHLDALTARLGGLGILDQDPAAEAVRNVVSSPLAGLDPTSHLDIRPVVRALEARLRDDDALHALPGKFGFLVDDGGALPLGGVAVDVRFEAVPAPQGPRLAVSAGGDAATAVAVGTCAPADVPEVAARLARAFLRLRDGTTKVHRMAALARRLGARALAEEAGLAFDPVSSARNAGRPARIVGVMAAGDLPVLGLAAPFGAWSADDLDRLALLAEREGTGEMRLTPWRAILLPGVASAAAAGDLIRDPNDARLSLAACTGFPGCHSATTRTREDGLSLAAVAHAISPAGIGVHVSGCAKGCAHPGTAPITLVARDGLYDLVLDGPADGTTLEVGLDGPAARARIAALARGGRGEGRA